MAIEPVRGQWAGVQTCATDYVGENAALQVTDTALFFEENTCKIRRNIKLGQNTFRLKLRCIGEGQKKTRSMILAQLSRSKVNDELLIRLELNTGFVMAYRRCP